MIKMYGAFDSQHKFIIQNQVEAKNKGFPEVEIDIAYDGTLWEKGYAQSKPQEIKEQEVRAVREQYFIDYVDFYQSKPLYWEELDETLKQDIANYRNYLKDYTKEENWWEKNPLNFEEFINDNLA